MVTMPAYMDGTAKLYCASLIRNPSPAFAPTISAAITTTIAAAPANRRPVKIVGIDAGRTTLPNSVNGGRFNDLPNFSRIGSTLRTAVIVLSRIGQVQA